MEPNESPFLPDSRQWAWNSSSLKPAKECPRKYQYEIVEGWRTKEESIHLTFGGIYAACLEVYHRNIANGLSHKDSRDAVVNMALKESQGKLKEEELKLLTGGARYKTRENLIRSIIWYLEEYRDDPCKTVHLKDGRPAVELPFRFELTNEVVLCGHIDRIVEFNDEYYVQDQKTTGSTLGAYYFNRFSPDNQMSLYTIASQIVWHSPVKGVMIDAAQIAVGFTRFGRGFAFRTKEQNEEWLNDTKEVIERTWSYTLNGYYPQNDTACQNYGGCSFREVCSRSPQVRQSYLETKFVKHFRNPLEVR